MPGGRSRSESVITEGSPARAITIPFSSIPSTNSSRIASPVGDSATASGRSRSRSSRLSTRNTARWPPESTGLRTAGNPTASTADSDVAGAAQSCPRRLRQAGRAERGAHRELVSQEVGYYRADAGESQGFGHRRHDGNRAVGRDRQHAVRGYTSGDVEDLLDRREVDDLGDVRGREARCFGVAVDRCDPKPTGARLLDRAPLMASRAHEEDRRHGGRCYLCAEVRKCRPAAEATERARSSGRSRIRSSARPSPTASCRRWCPRSVRPAVRRRAPCRRCSLAAVRTA